MPTDAERALAMVAEAERLFREDRLAESEALYRQAAAIERTANRVSMIATIRMLLGDLSAAERGFEEALAIDPSHLRARATLGLVHLHNRRFAEGFALYDLWRTLPELAPTSAPETGLPMWDGQDVAGKAVVVWGEEGFGDQIMYARFARLLAERGAEVGYVVRPELVRLVKEGMGLPAIPIQSEVKLEGAHYYIPSGRLPVVFMRTLERPPAEPYLRPPEPIRIPGVRIGLALKGNPDHENDRHRSLSPDAAAELLALPGAINLSPEETRASDFWDTARLIAGLDVVISVDTSVAHLAGALGKPVWVLLPAVGTDWRWGLEGQESEWYPTARLFRQPEPGDWAPVVAQVKAALG